ncbi:MULTISPECIES: amino acid ABC transporter permease [Mesorhizobium]|uniref:Polar amino acid transport system permease protein n=1 Tax=Mesorhizobium shonense TaxID=1209948 RepID=A0ABV2HP45_9HYPH|nr:MULTISPECIES: amino acid ABC transporter permease [unclassified Mesorhizobium]AZO28905.1 amino acid ABC transporter permease [Mesorhizobium sp. M1B.F.Ca.ET.045.04.1.1]RWA66940.1 MAG: ABC transporter permease subunit [Mesorhizobium sp.]RWA86763.1 MAG: ABC transporter permease subunit [Mesorhizobium sp.]RWB21292.1 MAG: ABC transporter permease subunit [Mesorhizobium sp.]RWE01843.1 MAG: ABC transporter permease subunit [Mesorhizobium sp.]
MQEIAAWFRSLYETTGLNFTIFYDPYDATQFARGVGMTIYLSVVSILISLVVGVIGAWLQSSRIRLVRGFIEIFVVIFRNTPPLVQIFFFYFGLGELLPASYNDIGLREPLLNNVQWAIISLSLFAGAFNIEIFRSGIEAVPQTTVEAAEALGYTRLGAYRYVVLPLALRVCLPALNNNLVNLLKTTTLAYAIAVPEALYAVTQIWAESQNVTEMMCVLLATFVLLVGVLVWVMHRWERSLRIPGFGQ